MSYEIRIREYKDGGGAVKQKTYTVTEAQASRILNIIAEKPPVCGNCENGVCEIPCEDATPVDFNGGCKDGVCEINFEKK